MTAAPDHAAQEERLRCGDGVLRLRVEGVGPPLVLVHGWALDLDVWEPQVEALRGAFRVVRYDRPGFGASTGRPSTPADVAALEAVVEHLGLRSFALAASSQGGRGALRFALANPQRVAALALDGVPLEGFLPGPRAEDAPPVAELAAALAAGGVTAVRRLLAANRFFQLRAADSVHRELLARVLDRYPAQDLAAAPPADAPPNVAARLAELPMPTLVVNGAHDSPHRLLIGDALAYGLPDATRAVLSGAGHLSNLDRAAEYAELLRGFLSRHGLAPPASR